MPSSRSRKPDVAATCAWLPVTDAPPDADQATLSDGSVVALRLAVPDDRDELTRFFHRLSRESLRRRFFGPVEPSARLLDTFCASSHPEHAATLVAFLAIDGETRAVAVASYFRIDAATAEIAFAVEDRFQGHGLGTMLLDRLAALARARGFTQFAAVTLPDNARMLDMFRDSGFEVQLKPERGCITVQLSLTPPLVGPSVPPHSSPRQETPTESR
jgi:GNAT superfamily N-acetyltransferase